MKQFILLTGAILLLISAANSQRSDLNLQSKIDSLMIERMVVKCGFNDSISNSLREFLFTGIEKLRKVRHQTNTNEACYKTRDREFQMALSNQFGEEALRVYIECRGSFRRVTIKMIKDMRLNRRPVKSVSNTYKPSCSCGNTEIFY